MKKLYNHQIEIIQKDPKKCGLFLGTGSAKTRIALELAQGKILVIVPKTQKEDNLWERENIKWDINKDLTIISKEKFRTIANTLPKFDTVICEEAHTCLGVTPNICWKNRQPVPKTSQLFNVLKNYIQKTKPNRLYLLTATIIKNPMTVWGAGIILGYNWNFYKWRDTFYFKLPMAGREVFAVKNNTENKNKLSTIVNKIGFTGKIEDYVDMPEQIFKVIYVNLKKKQLKKIKELPFEYPDPLVLQGKIHCVENGCLIGDEYSPTELFDNEKIEKILELSFEFPRMVVFAKYRSQIAQIASTLIKEGKKVITLTGDTKERGVAILEANNSEECIFIVQSQLSMGYELPNYPVMIFASLDWSLVNYIQAIGRISRINNPKRNLYIHLVVKGKTIDGRVYQTVVINKMDFHLQMYEKRK